MLPNFWLYTFGHMWNNFDPETWCYFFRKNKQPSTAIEDKKKELFSSSTFWRRDFLKKKTLTLKEVWQMVVFGKRKMIMHILTYCWNSWGQHLVMCLSIPRVSAADAARLHYFFWKLLKYYTGIFGRPLVITYWTARICTVKKMF